MDQAVEFANELAPEHLEICVNNPFDYLGRLDNAGSILWGTTPQSLWGTTSPGPTTCCPPGAPPGFSPLCPWTTSSRKSSFLYYPKEELEKAGADIIRLAETEELTAHANSVKVRLEQ